MKDYKELQNIPSAIVSTLGNKVVFCCINTAFSILQ